MLLGRINLKIYLVLIAISLVAAVFKPLGILFILLFPFLPAFKITKNNYLVSMPIAVSLNVLTAIVNAVILDTFNLPVNPFCIVLLTFMELTLIIFFTKKPAEINVDKSDTKYLYIVYSLFGLALMSRVGSVFDLFAPILHDPEAHAFWASRIVEENAIDYFYSPGLHVWSMLTTEAFSVSTARTTHLITNFFNAFSVLSWGILVYAFTKFGRLAMWTATLVLATPIPQFLYFMAGKNAFVMAISFLSISALFCHYFYIKQGGTSFVLFLLSLVGVGLIHYPTFALAICCSIIYLFISFWRDKRQMFNKSVHYFKFLLRLLLPIIIAVFLIGGNVIITKIETPAPPAFSSNKNAKSYHQDSLKLDTIPSPEKYSVAKSVGHVRVISPISGFSDLKKEVLGFYKSLPNNVGIFMLGMVLPGLYFLLVTKQQKEYRSYYHLWLSFVISLLFVSFILLILPIKGLGTTQDTAILLSPFVFTLPLAWLLTAISKKPAVEYLSIVLLSLLVCVFSFNIYKAKSSGAYVDVYDIRAFDWINSNIDDSENFISQSVLDPNRNSIVFPVSGALWLPVFTGNNISSPFHQGGFKLLESHENYEYSRLLGENNLDATKLAVEYFTSRGYRYIYIDGSAAKHEFQLRLLKKSGLAKVVYDSGEVVVVMLTPN